MVIVCFIQISDSHWGGVRVRLYEPKGQVSNGPAMIWIHGGGWVTRTVGEYSQENKNLRPNLLIWSVIQHIP